MSSCIRAPNMARRPGKRPKNRTRHFGDFAAARFDDPVDRVVSLLEQLTACERKTVLERIGAKARNLRRKKESSK